jgi:hypothetical protein
MNRYPSRILPNRLRTTRVAVDGFMTFHVD